MVTDEAAPGSVDYGQWFQAQPVAQAVLDTQGRVLAANEALCGLLGYSQDTITTLSWADVLAPQEQHSELAVLDGALAGRQRCLLDANGQPVICEVYSTLSGQQADSRVWLTTLVDVGRWHRYAAQLQHEKRRDELTGLLSRTGTQHLLAALLADDTDRQLAVLFCDIDNFKRINDALGHEVGDELLVTLARRLESGLPEGCTAARHSGDEFLVVCSDLQAIGGLDALTGTVSTLLRPTIAPHGYQIQVSAAIGAVTAHRWSHTPQDLLRFADAAMYRAKSQGPGQVACAKTGSGSSLEQELQLEEQLRQALARDELLLHYQPIVDHTGQVISAEALLRWPHPQRGLLSPGEILPAARRAGLLGALDQWVLATAAREAAAWPAPDGRLVGVAVNLGSQLLHDPKLAPRVAELVTDSGLAWDRLILEISETDLLDLAPATQQAMSDLVEAGARFAVDDFGTGYSSLERLKDLPIQVVKLDRKFVAGIEDEPVDAAIAGAALSIAHARGSTCIAEGVETTGQLYRLASLGYATHQGFLFAPAVPAANFRALITHPPLLTEHSRDQHPSPSGSTTEGARRQGEVTHARGLTPTGHLCWAYDHPEQFRARAREYILDGIRAGQQIEYIGDGPVPALRAQLTGDETLAAALEAGAITVGSVHDFYRLDPTRGIDPDRAVASRIAATETALADGYSGFRAIVDATALARTPIQREAFAHFEYLIDHVMSTHPVTALCAYDLTELGSAAVAELACLHPLTSPQSSPFRLYAEPAVETNGHDTHLALAGHIDLPCADLLTQALGHAQQNDLLINDRGLTFLDPHALLALDRHARHHHQHLTLRLAPPLATRLAPHLDELTHTRIQTHPH